LFSNCIVPVGAAPLLSVVTVAVTEICVPTSPDEGTPLMEVVVVALVMVIGVVEVLVV
jgi:hypothetical protein